MNGEQSQFRYKYRTVSVNRLKDLQADIDRLKEMGKLSKNGTFQEYLSEMRFAVPEDMPEAKSIIIMAVFTRLMMVDFHLNGRVYQLMLPPQYYKTGLTQEQLEATIQEEIIGEQGYSLKRTTDIHLKLTAARSGLARYGRNNITYVDEFGSLITLYAYFTDYQFPKQSWTEIELLEQCSRCKVCVNHCPMGTIHANGENFVIDVGNCVTLYNEGEGEFPAHIPAEAHNALMGCMRCQLLCPANKQALKEVGRLDAIFDEETRMILSGNHDKQLMENVAEKLRGFPPAAYENLYPVFTRNLAVLIRDQALANP